MLISRLFVKGWRFVLRVISNMKLSLYPFWIQFNAKGYKVRGTDIERVMQEVSPGDVLLRGYDQFLGSRLIGRWSHAGIVVDSTHVVHALGDGVRNEHILDFMRCDRIWVLRPNLIYDRKVELVNYVRSLVGRPYDYLFLFNDPRELSCTELWLHTFERFPELKIEVKDRPIFGKVVKPIDIPTFPDFETIIKVDQRS